ncbi:MAG: phospholipase D family protein [Planctomycetota bacterium]
MTSKSSGKKMAESVLPDEFTYLENREIYEAVVLGGVARARRSIDIATANVKDMHVESGRRFVSIVAILDQLCRKGVRIRLLHSGRPSGPFRQALNDSRLLDRPTFEMKRCVRVHFKAVVIDGRDVYLGSANLSGAGIGAKGEHRRNFEIGFLTSDDFIRRRVAALFDEIWEGKHCPKCGRRRECVQAEIASKSEQQKSRCGSHNIHSGFSFDGRGERI